MSNKPLKISEEAAVQMPMKTVASLIAMVAIGTWAYFGLHEMLNNHATKIELMQKDLEQNTEFRIKYPRGELTDSIQHWNPYATLRKPIACNQQAEYFLPARSHKRSHVQAYRYGLNFQRCTGSNH